MIKNNKQPRFIETIVKSFDDPNNPSKIHPELLRFTKHVAKIAVMGFSKKELEDYYKENFHEAQITYVYYGKEIIGFFIAVFKKIPDAKGNVIGYSGSGFPGLKYKLRHSNVVSFKEIMARLTMKYIVYYLNNKSMNPTPPKPLPKYIAMLSKLGLMTLSSGANQGNKTALKILSYLGQAMDKGNLTIIAVAENPIMYATLMASNLRFVGKSPKPLPKEIVALSHMKDPQQLISASYLQSKNTKRHACLMEPKFVVTIPAKDWRDFFINVFSKNDKKTEYMKYFLWQNFNFPDTAFQFVFKVDLRNIYATMLSMNS